MSTVLQPELIRREVSPPADVVRGRLAGARGRLRWHLACDGLAWTVCVTAVLVLSSFVIDRWLRLGTGTRLALLPIGLAILVATIYYRLVRPLRLPLADLDLAVILDARSPGVAERVANVLQLPGLLQSDPGASPSMIRATVIRQADELARLDWHAPFNRSRQRAVVLAILVPSVLLVLAAVLWPTTASLWARRWLLASGHAGRSARTCRLSVWEKTIGCTCRAASRSWSMSTLGRASSPGPAAGPCPAATLSSLSGNPSRQPVVHRTRCASAIDKPARPSRE